MQSNMETPEKETERQRKTFRWWYEAKLAERLLQAAQMAKDRGLIRRGARKMQDGQLGAAGGHEVEEEPVNISIGDTHYHRDEQSSVDVAPQTKTPLWQKAAVAAALLGGGAGLGVAASELLKDDPPAVEYTDTDTDTDTQYVLRFSD